MVDSLDLALAHFGDVYTENGHVQCPRGHVLDDYSSFCARCGIFVEGCYRESCRERVGSGESYSESAVLMRVVQYERDQPNGLLARVTVKTLDVAPPLTVDDVVAVTMCPHCGVVVGGSDEKKYALRELLVPRAVWASSFADYIKSLESS
jgi:hypothetical protein